MGRKWTWVAMGMLAAVLFSAGWAASEEKTGREKTDGEFLPLFPGDSLESWKISDWSDLRTAQKVEGEAWTLQKGVLEGMRKRTWLYSTREYDDFELKFEWRITEGANAGLGLRFPPEGDPAYKGMEIQMVDAETYYRGNAKPNQITGSIYDELPARVDAMKPVGEWNRQHVTCRGSRVKIVLNDQVVVDVDLDQFTQAHQQKGPALAKRPRKGRLGFQNLNGGVTLREIQIKTLK